MFSQSPVWETVPLTVPPEIRRLSPGLVTAKG